MNFPVELSQVSSNTLGIKWDDQKQCEIQVRDLRMQCPCASCVDEWTNERTLKEENVPQGVQPVNMHTVGRYALRIFWSDGHDTGIYPFKVLRALCENI
jgi:DUF971 family protein